MLSADKKSGFRFQVVLAHHISDLDVEVSGTMSSGLLEAAVSSSEDRIR